LSCPSADARCLKLPSYDQTAPKRLVDGLDLELRSDRARRNDVNERSERRGHAHAVDCLNVSRDEPRVVQAEHVRNGGHPPESGRHRHVQLRRHQVGEVVQRQRGRVAKNPLWLVLPVPRPELPDHQVGPGWRRKLRQPVHAACLTDPVSGPNLIRVDAVLVPGVERLAGGKKAALGLRRLVELPECDGIAWHAIKPQMILGIIARDASIAQIMCRALWLNSGTDFELCVMDADGGNLQVLTNNTTPDLTPNWTPDGSKIIFHRSIGGFNQLHIMNADGTDVEQLTATVGHNLFANPGSVRVRVGRKG
jgi:hypothetical protein